MGRRIPLLALLLAVALTACTDEPEPKFADPTTSSAPTTSARPSEPTETSSPPPRKESPQDFIRRFQRASFEMQNSGDSSIYRSLSSNCESCDALAGRVDDIYEAGGRIQIDRSSVRAMRVTARVDGVVILEYELHVSPTIITDSSGTVTKRFTGGVSKFQVNVRRESGSWAMSRVSRLVEQ